VTSNGSLNGASGVVSGLMRVGTLSSGNVTSSGAVTAAAATVNGPLTASSGTVTGALSAASASISGDISAASLSGLKVMDTGWVSDFTMISGFSNYASSVKVRIRNGIIFVAGTMQFLTAVSAGLSTDVQFLTFGSTITDALTSYGGVSGRPTIGMLQGTAQNSTAHLAMSSTGLWLSYRETNPAANQYAKLWGNACI